MSNAKSTEPFKEPSFHTFVIETSLGEYEASYLVDGIEVTLGRYKSAQEANIAALLGVRAYYRDPPSRE